MAVKLYGVGALLPMGKNEANEQRRIATTTENSRYKTKQHRCKNQGQSRVQKNSNQLLVMAVMLAPPPTEEGTSEKDKKHDDDNSNCIVD